MTFYELNTCVCEKLLLFSQSAITAQFSYGACTLKVVHCPVNNHTHYDVTLCWLCFRSDHNVKIV